MREPLSHFARFFLEFQGYDFYDHTAKKKLEKYELWANHKYLCHIMTKKGKVVSKFTLISRAGWRNGLKIEEKK